MSTKKKKAESETLHVEGEQKYLMIQVGSIIPSPYQTRKDGDVSELAASIRSYGVLNPITVRTHFDGYQLIAGHRRWAACIEAGKETVPAIVIECSDQAAAEICVTENLQRKSLTPLEEASGVEALISTGHTLDDIASRLGRTRQWVARRASLTKLCPEIKARLEKPEDFLAKATVEVLEIVARMPIDIQNEMVETFRYHDTIPSAAVLRQLGQQKMCSLANPAFSIKDCLTCTSRTGATPDLFDEIEGELGDCLNRECYRAKEIAAKKLLVEELIRETPGIIIVSANAYELRNAIPEVEGLYAHIECKKDDEGAIPAVELLADGNIRNFWVFGPDAETDEIGEDEATPETYETQVHLCFVNIVRKWLKAWQDKLEGKCSDEDLNLKTPFNTLADRGDERVILRLVSAFGTNCSCEDVCLDDKDGFLNAPFSSLMRKLFFEFCDKAFLILYVHDIEEMYAIAITIADACGLEKEHLIKCAKKLVEDGGVSDPAENADEKGDE